MWSYFHSSCEADGELLSEGRCCEKSCFLGFVKTAQSNICFHLLSHFCPLHKDNYFFLLVGFLLYQLLEEIPAS